MVNIGKKEKIKLLKTMKKIRSFEEAVFKLTSQSLVQGSVHFYIGQEAIATGICHCIDKKDYVMSNHRGHGHMIARGARLEKMMAELMGRKDGYCKGKGGTMHLLDPSIGMMGANGIVGGGNPIAVGLGYACKNFEKERIVVSFFGDGALNTGAFHESLNLASVWELPILFVCENNQYAISTSVDYSTPLADLSKRAASYGIVGTNIDGNNILKVIDETKNCIKAIKKDKRPVLLVCNTYRHMGHSIHDPRTYRTKEEEKNWKKKDPILLFESKLLKEKTIDQAAIKDMQKDIDRDIEKAIGFGKKSPKPGKQELFNDIYA